MGTQQDFFDVFDDCERIRARASDPHTSHEAALENFASGRLNAQCKAVLAALKQLEATTGEGSTSAEIGLVLPPQGKQSRRHVAGRRLPDLEKRGLVRRGEARRCLATGRQAITWWVR